MQIQTADGYDLKVGDTIWVRPTVLCPKEPPIEAVVGSLEDGKIWYDKPDKDGYVGARNKSVFHKKENAYWTKQVLIETGVFSQKEIDDLMA